MAKLSWFCIKYVTIWNQKIELHMIAQIVHIETIL